MVDLEVLKWVLVAIGVTAIILFLYAIGRAVQKGDLPENPMVLFGEEQPAKQEGDNVIPFKKRGIGEKEYYICGTASDCPFKREVSVSKGRLPICWQSHTDCPDRDEETVMAKDKEVL